MDNTNIPEPTVPPIQNYQSLKSYYCPHCNRFLFKGNVQKLNMVCHYCQKMIIADEKDLIKKKLNEYQIIETINAAD